MGCSTPRSTPLTPPNITASGGVSSHIEGKAFYTSVDWKILQSTPQWNPHHGKPPISLSEAERAASQMLAKTVANLEEWKLSEITLKQPFEDFKSIPEGFWIYEFTFNGPKDQSDAKFKQDSRINIWVLMSGEVVPLKPIEPRLK